MTVKGICDFGYDGDSIFIGHNNRKMEESRFSTQSKSRDPEMLRELQKINEIEKSVMDMQTHLRFLLKKDQEEDKKTSKLYDSSIKLTNIKLQHATSRLQKNVAAEEKQKDHSQKKAMLKDTRERDLNSLQQTRRQISEFKQNQQKELKQISRKNQMKIRTMKENQMHKNSERAIFMRQQHAERLRKIQAAKQFERKKKQDQVMKRSYARLTSKATMELQLEKLKEQEKQIQRRLNEKKALQAKLQQGVRKITEMDNEEVIKLAQKERSQEEGEEIAVEQALIKEAAKIQVQKRL